MLAQVHQQGLIPPDWILSDTWSTDNVVNNKGMINNVELCTEEDSLKIYTNGGVLEYNQVGDNRYFPIRTYFNPQSIANVLSLKTVNEMNGYHVTMDTQDDLSIKLHHGTATLRFPHSMNGLYYCTKDKSVEGKTIVTL